MQSREKRSQEWPFNKPQATRRNGRLMLLLEMVPEFERDIAILRNKLGIPIGGYRPGYENDMNDPEERAARAETRKSVDKKMGLVDGKSGQSNYFMPSPIGTEERKPKEGSLEYEVVEIGKKYHLPYSLCNSSFWGIAHYVLYDEIVVPPKNWDITIEPQLDGRLPIRWAEIRAYAPLDNVEAKEALAALDTALRQHLPSGLASKQRVGKVGEKNLMDVARLIEQRRLKAKGRTMYERGGYLDTARRKGDKTPKQMRQLKKSRLCEIVSLSAMTDRERKLLARANEFALVFFGHGILSDNKSLD